MLLSWIVVGAFAGWLAGIITGSEQGCLTNLVVGMIGSILGGTLEYWLQTGVFTINTEYTEFSLKSVFMSFLGALVLLGVLTGIRKLFK